jgi:hypothetical protein
MEEVTLSGPQAAQRQGADQVAARSLDAVSPRVGVLDPSRPERPRYGPLKFRENPAALATTDLPFCSPVAVTLLELIACGRVTERGEWLLVDGQPVDGRDDDMLTRLWGGFLARHSPVVPLRWELTPLGAQTAALWAVRGQRERYSIP